MADDKNKGGSAAGGKAPRQAEEALREGADQLRNQMGNMADMAGMSAKVSQELIQRSGQNFEMMKRIAETMTSGARSAAAECAEYAKHSAKRQTEMMRQLAAARSPNDVLDIQTRFLQDNLTELLSFSERLSRLSADKAREATEGISRKT
ncbi:hypothetical protein N825_04325 [Skermanella stibiiresistens SB22]|uniref:Phasin domain-containing protein n=1 Tax=Skermanella stibiiresistens SB22 TaxID=1385369 RepID=W9H1F3_9PROT|nr:phasin family protein [Skermanella stibiiresistens]EWY39899.1 hypothetical protein N825_04325 [Skermanella stibiiresistens SB22]